MKLLGWGLLVAVALYGLHRLALWMERRGWIYYRTQGNPTSVGNAFLEVHALFDPAKRHTLVVRTEKKTEQDGSGAPPVPGTAIVLRDVEPADLEIFYEHQRDEDAALMAAFPSRDRDSFMAHWAKIRVDPNVVLRTIEVEGETAGNIVSWVTQDERDVGYWLGREFWDRGIATAALRRFITDVISERPLIARVATHNAGSRRVLEKCGFTVVSESAEELVLRLE